MPQERVPGKPTTRRYSEEEKAQLPPVTGIRIPIDLLDEIDTLVGSEKARLASEGATTNRNALVVRLLREALDASTGRLDVIARQYDAERETARRMIVDLGRWCELAEEHVIAIAREQDATDSKGGEK